MSEPLRTVRAITLFVEDLAATRAFYERAFEASPVFEDDNSAVSDVGGTLVNLLDVSAAGELVARWPSGRPWGVRTVACADPAGHLWELAQPLGG